MNIENLTDKELDHFLDCDDKVIYLREMSFKSSGERFSTGFKVFDEALDGGIKEGDLIVISGRSGEGKTTLAQTLTYNFCKRGIPCLWFSYEVTLKEVDKKFRSMGIDDFYEVAVPEKNTSGKIEWIKEKIKEGWAKFMTKIVIIDHIDFLIPSDCRTGDNEQASLKRIATELKQLALELGISVICMAHVKKVDEHKDLSLYDIGYSAGIFQLADTVFMVSRERNKKNSYSLDESEPFSNNTIVKIVKNRQTGCLKNLKLVYANGKYNELSNRTDELPEGGY